MPYASQQADDSHCGGRTVIRCVTDGGTKLIYKPHSLKKDEIYQNLFGELCRRTGLTAFFCRVLDRGSYGWSQYLRHAPCADREGAGRYYERMGIHLFLCMLLNGSDMHRENILAVGEYPVILDMETLPGVREKGQCLGEDLGARVFRHVRAGCVVFDLGSVSGFGTVSVRSGGDCAVASFGPDVG